MTPHWTKLNPHPSQTKAFESQKRFNVIPAGRRSGKTEFIGKRKMVTRFITCKVKKLKNGKSNPFYSPYPDPRFFIAAPTRDQVKRIYWSDVKKLTPRQYLTKSPNESNLELHGTNGATLFLFGLDKPERIEGSPWDHGVIDEIANVKASAWPLNIRPALSDRVGGCDFIGVPEGRNHFFEMYEQAKAEMDDPNGEWGAFTWTAEQVLPLFGRQDEIESARKYLDPLVYEQEYLASFLSFSGQAYHRFDANIHVGRYAQYYSPKKPIVIAFDFNVSPGIAVIGQEMGSDVFDIPIGETITVWIGEVYIPRQSNTIMVCNKIIQYWQGHTGLVLCYGDATGGAKGSAKVRGSDWDLIRDTLFPCFGPQLHINVSKSNPKERQRVNSLNSRIMSVDGSVRMLVDGNCKNLVRDLEGTRVIEGSAGK
jgi:hypothetical protein